MNVEYLFTSLRGIVVEIHFMEGISAMYTGYTIPYSIDLISHI